MSNQPLLMSEEEPSDDQLSALMQGIGLEAKQKAILAEKQLQGKIQQEIKEAQARHKAKAS